MRFAIKIKRTFGLAQVKGEQNFYRKESFIRVFSGIRIVNNWESKWVKNQIFEKLNLDGEKAF